MSGIYNGPGGQLLHGDGKPVGSPPSPKAERQDVTKHVDFAEVDGEHIPLTKCVCGAVFRAWDQVVSIYPERPWECPKCGDKLFFTCEIRVYKLL